jgi:arginase family enzyme
MEISIFFEPANFDQLNFDIDNDKSRLGSQITLIDQSFNEEDLSSLDVVLLGINEDRHALQNAGCANAPDEIRKYLYQLFPGKKFPKIGDLGNIRAGDRPDDTYFAIKATMARLLKNGLKVVVMGGGQDMTYPLYLGYEEAKHIINLVAVDAIFDIQPSDGMPNSRSYIADIIYRKPSFLFNFSNIGYQSYLVNPEEIKLLEGLYFDTLRLGRLRDDITEAEPFIRNADLLSFDISSVRASDAPGNYYASPNGLYAEEACRLAGFAGLSAKLSTIGFFETNPLFDNYGQTAHLTAQLIWHFFDGLANRMDDYPDEQSADFLKYIVSENTTGDMTFFKSKLSGRWWMQLPVAGPKEKKYARHIMVPCSYNDYLMACENEIPDRWWKAYQKLM